MSKQTKEQTELLDLAFRQALNNTRAACRVLVDTLDPIAGRDCLVSHVKEIINSTLHEAGLEASDVGLLEVPDADALAPLVHLNGSSKDDLLGQWDRFQNALRESCPNLHRRDYYAKRDEAEAEVAIERFAAIVDALHHLAAKVSKQILDQPGR